MKTMLLLMFLLAGGVYAAPKRVLFIGNSFTYHGAGQDLPNAFYNIAVSAGQEAPVVSYYAPGSTWLLDHLYDANALALIDQGGWDFVVLQEQSVVPACAATDPDYYGYFYDGASGLYDAIKASNPGAQVVLYETWAWSEARIAQGNVYCNSSGDLPDAATMQARIVAAYEAVASNLIATGRSDVRIARVGEAREVNRTYANLNMFSDASQCSVTNGVVQIIRRGAE